MGNTSAAVKYRYNKKTYKSFNSQLKPELFERVETFRNEKGFSRSEFLTYVMDLIEKTENKQV